MNGMTLMIIGGVVAGLGVIVGIYSIIFEATTAKRIKKQLEREYEL